MTRDKLNENGTGNGVNGIMNEEVDGMVVTTSGWTGEPLVTTVAAPTFFDPPLVDPLV